MIHYFCHFAFQIIRLFSYIKGNYGIEMAFKFLSNVWKCFQYNLSSVQCFYKLVLLLLFTLKTNKSYTRSTRLKPRIIYIKRKRTDPRIYFICIFFPLSWSNRPSSTSESVKFPDLSHLWFTLIFSFTMSITAIFF